MKTLTDTWLLYRRHMKKLARNPIWFFIGLSQPILYMLLYMPLLRTLSGGAALGDVARLFVPGMLIIMGMGSLFAGFGFIPEMREGIIARWLVTPVSRLGFLVSLILENTTTLVLQATILVLIALLFGLKVPLEGVLGALALLLLVCIAMCCLSYTISISVKNESALATVVNTFYLPILLLSGIMLPISLAPTWIKRAAMFNPFYYAVEASRALFAGNLTAPIVIAGFALMATLAGVMVFFALRALRNMVA